MLLPLFCTRIQAMQSWRRPSLLQQTACPNRSGSFNYAAKYSGATASDLDPSAPTSSSSLQQDGFALNHFRVMLGSGFPTYQRAKRALLSWKHFGLDWAFVEPSNPVSVGEKFCVCVKEFVPWTLMPLQIVYVRDQNSNDGDSIGRKNVKSAFAFGSGTLQGHLLWSLVIDKCDRNAEFFLRFFQNKAGEERFSVELDENNKVWYEILSFSKPAHFLSCISHPYVRFRQKQFAHQSMDALVKHMKIQESI